MATFFNSVHITNFKSLKDVTLSDCKRINLLIGKPNVGKSNILEAIGFFGVLNTLFSKDKKLSKFVRFENIPELFFNGNTDEPIIINANDNHTCSVVCQDSSYGGAGDHLRFFGMYLSIHISSDKNKSFIIYVDDNFDIYMGINTDDDIRSTFFSRVNQYRFPHNLAFEKINIPYLLPPFGVNLISVIQEKKELRADLSKIISKYGWKLNIDTANQSLRVLKELGEDTIFTLPYGSIADTLQRLIFYKTAIASNKNSILLFEEPEAHCFPPYITHIAKEIIDSESNQFFIATHSPYILDTFLEKNRDDLAIYMADFKDGQTVIKRLTDMELNDVYEYGLDLFFNAELFTDEI